LVIDVLRRHSVFVIPAMAKKAQIPPKSFEDALAELEQILADIEHGELGLEESLAKYERGNFLIHHCRGVLSGAEKQIELLSKSADGGLTVTPLQDEPAADAPDNADHAGS
jgi:exodeoxyribonuclease VII small subunit